MLRDKKLLSKIQVIIALLFVLNGCGGLKPIYLSPGYRPPRIIALLPFNNQSVDLNAPTFVRRIFKETIEMRGYKVQPQKEVDDILRAKLSITDGGQLTSVKPEKIGAVLSVEALVYGDILDFSIQTIGVYQNKIVRLRFKMVDAKTGQTIWEDEARSAEKTAATSVTGAAKVLGTTMAKRAAGNVREGRRQVQETEGEASKSKVSSSVGALADIAGLEHPLKTLTVKVARRCGATIPRGFGEDADLKPSGETTSQFESYNETIEYKTETKIINDE
ncbi:MAG: DUF799 family lipoprotein [Elusimicrobia bacterium]|nr:DUF799 family lipoprotein [Elusimicrobiota bacterium]